MKKNIKMFKDLSFNDLYLFHRILYCDFSKRLPMPPPQFP